MCTEHLLRARPSAQHWGYSTERAPALTSRLWVDDEQGSDLVWFTVLQILISGSEQWWDSGRAEGEAGATDVCSSSGKGQWQF